MPPSSTRRVERSMKNRTIKRCRPVQVHTSTVQKSVARICSQCRVRNSFHVVLRLRSGAGSIPCLFRILAIVLRANMGPTLARAPWIRRYTQLRFSLANRRTFAVISVAVRGRPGARYALPSYFLAINFRCQAKQGYRRDDGRDLFQDFPAELLRPCCQTATLVVRESHPSVPNLFSKDAIFLGEIFNDMLLVLVHPASDRNDQKREWIQTDVHFRSLARSMWKLFERIGPSESSFWILRGAHSRSRIEFADGLQNLFQF